MIRPSGETNDPEPPAPMRTQLFWMCWTQSSVGSKPYLSFQTFLGNLLEHHMPSSARAAVRQRTRQETDAVMSRRNMRAPSNKRMRVESNPPYEAVDRLT